MVLFSASSKLYADTIAQEIECKGRIFDFRLYKEHLTLYKGRMVKDIRRLGRDLAKTIIVDDISTNFMSCPENGIEVSSWVGDKNDGQLIDVLRVIKDLVEGADVAKEGYNVVKEGYDVRKELCKHR